MVKRDLMKKLGSMQQVAYIRKVRFEEGRAGNMKAIEVKNGPISYTMMEDKCLDICQLAYNGIGLNFLSKPGLQGRCHYDTNGQEAQRSIMGGLMFTCGTDNVGVPNEVDGTAYPMHGRLRSTPAEHVCADSYWDGDEYKIVASGEMRQSMLFGENIVLRRTIETHLGSNIIHIHDEVENQAYIDTPLMFLYHCNIGYPLLDENSKIIIPASKSFLKGNEKKETQEEWNKVTEPVDNLPEQVFYHELSSDKENKTHVAIINEELELGIMLRFNKEQLPCFAQWKSMASGDYVIGLEPSNCHVEGRGAEKKRKTLRMLAPFEKVNFDLEIVILDKKKNIWI